MIGSRNVIPATVVYERTPENLFSKTDPYNFSVSSVVTGIPGGLGRVRWGKLQRWHGARGYEVTACFMGDC